MPPVKKLLALVLLAGCAQAPPAEPQALPFRAGVATVEITPTRNVPLAGYAEREGKLMTGVHDPLYAKALWIETDAARVCIVTADVLGFPLAMRDRIRPEDADVVLLGSTTRSGPAFDEALTEETAGKLLALVENARAAAQPARLAFARGTRMDILRISDEFDRPLAILAGCTVPANLLKAQNLLASGDWPGAFQRRLESALSVTVLFANGATGGLTGETPEGRNAFERCEALGESLAREAAHMARSFDNALPEATISYVETEAELPEGRKSVVGLLTLAGVRMFCLPGEPEAELGRELKGRFPGSWVLEAADDSAGRLPTKALREPSLRLGEGLNAEDRAAQPEGGSREDDDRR